MQKSQRKVGMMLSYVNSLLLVAVNIFLTPFLIKTLGNSEYGVYQMMASFGGYLVLINFGTGTIMTRFVSVALAKKDRKAEENSIATCLLISLGLGAVILIAATVLFVFLESIYASSMTPPQIEKAKVLYLFVAGNVFVMLFANTLQGIITAYEKFVVNSFWQIFKTFLKAVLVIFFLSIKSDSIIIVAVDLFLSLSLLVFELFYVLFGLKVRWKIYSFDKELFTSSAVFALAIFLQSVVNQVNTKVDVTILGIMKGPESVTTYSVAMQVFMVFSSVSSAAIAVYLPKFSRMCANGKPDGKTITDATIEPSRVQTLMSGAILFGFLICGRDFINVWMGDEYAFAWVIAVIILIPSFLLYTNGVIVSVLDAMGKRLIRSLVLAGIALCNIALTVVLVYFFGEIGAPIGTAIATFVGSVVIMNIYYVKVLGFKLGYFCVQVFKGIIPSLLAATAVSLPFVFILDVGLWGLVIKAGVFVVTLSISLWLFGFNKAEKDSVKGFFKRRKG